MRRFVFIIIALIIGTAAAFDVPADGTFVLTSADGLVVGVGSLERGERLTLDLLAGFRGRARLLLIAIGGAVTVLEVEIADERITLGDADWLELLAAAGFHEHVITGLAAPTTRAPLLRAGSDARSVTDTERPGTPDAPTPPTAGPAPQVPVAAGGPIDAPDVDGEDEGRRDRAPGGQ